MGVPNFRRVFAKVLKDRGREQKARKEGSLPNGKPQGRGAPAGKKASVGGKSFPRSTKKTVKGTYNRGRGGAAGGTASLFGLKTFPRLEEGKVTSAPAKEMRNTDRNRGIWKKDRQRGKGVCITWRLEKQGG